jgi:hypothetical protein
MEFYRQGMLLQDIADRLQADRNTVTSAVKHWHTVRGLPVPDGRTRRKELEAGSSPKDKIQSVSQEDPPPETQPEGGGNH